MALRRIALFPDSPYSPLLYPKTRFYWLRPIYCGLEWASAGWLHADFSPLSMLASWRPTTSTRFVSIYIRAVAACVSATLNPKSYPHPDMLVNACILMFWFWYARISKGSSHRDRHLPAQQASEPAKGRDTNALGSQLRALNAVSICLLLLTGILKSLGI